MVVEAMRGSRSAALCLQACSGALQLDFYADAAAILTTSTLSMLFSVVCSSSTPFPRYFGS